MYIFYLYKIYMYTYMYLYSHLPAKTGHRGGRCLQYVKHKESARERQGGGFWIWVWTIFTKEKMNFLSSLLTRGRASSPDSSACSLHEASFGQTATQELTLVLPRFSRGSSCYFSTYKNALKKLYWKGGWQALVQFSFQHFGTDWKGNLLNKNL